MKILLALTLIIVPILGWLGYGLWLGGEAQEATISLIKILLLLGTFVGIVIKAKRLIDDV